MNQCSISWTIDEAFSSRNAKNMTLQRTLISEALNYAGHATILPTRVRLLVVQPLLPLLTVCLG